MLSVTRKVLSVDVFFIDRELNQELVYHFNHAWGSGNVIDRVSQVTYVFGKHLGADVAGCPLPSTMAGGNASKRWKKVKVLIRHFQIPQSLHKGSVFDVSISIKEKDRRVNFVDRGGGKHA